MTDDNFVERVHAYSKWMLGLEANIESTGFNREEDEVHKTLAGKRTNSRRKI